MRGFRGSWRPRTGVPIAAVVAAEGIRLWCMVSLGSRWNVRVLVLADEPPIRSGPYRFLRHPNYAAVAIELAAFPLALGLVWAAAAVLPLKLLAWPGSLTRFCPDRRRCEQMRRSGGELVSDSG